VLDLFALAFARRNPGLDADALPELDLVGPTGLERLLRSGEGPLGSWARDPRQRVTEVDPAALEPVTRGALLLDPGRARHNDEALSWRVVAPSGASLVYSGDTGETPALAELAGRDGGADLLVAECALELEEQPDRHLHGAAAGRAARDAGVGGLLLTHFYPHVDPDRAVAAAAQVYRGPIWAAVDGTRIRLRPGATPELLA
jgi:ribonuclease BN (tRNA processing enzyme)